MSKITQNYIEARRDGIKWLNSQKRDYSTGVNILTRSGYKGFVITDNGRGCHRDNS